MKNQPNDNPITWMRNFLQPWLEREDWRSTDLIDYLQGYFPPPVGPGEEPYLWLLRGLPIGSDRPQAEQKLATRVAAVLRERPDEQRPGKRPEQVLYNLLLLCAGLSAPDQLTEPLTELLKRQMESETLRGGWNGLELSDCLREALIENQLDNRFEPYWEQMLAGKSLPALPGHPPQGFSGVLWMPPSASERGKPSKEAIGKALAAITTYIDAPDQFGMPNREKPSTPVSDGEKPNRRERFRRFVARVVEAYPGHSWDFDLLLMSDKNHWPGWAVECLPRLYLPVDSSPNYEEVIVWHYALACLPSGCQYRVVKKLCDERVYQVSVSPVTARLLQRIALFLEERRLGNPYPSDRSMVASVAEAMQRMQLEAEWHNDVSTAAELEQVKNYLLEQTLGEPNPTTFAESVKILAVDFGEESERKDEWLELVKPVLISYPSLDLIDQKAWHQLPAWSVSSLNQ